MGQLNRKGDLAAAQIAFFSPAFCVAAYVVFRHGFSRQLGWIYLNILSILRLIGASCLLYAEVNNDYSDGLLVTAAITSAIGTAPLLLVLLGFLERIHAHMLEGKGVHRFVFQAIHLASLAGLIMAIIGGTDINSANNTSDSTYHTGRALMEAASIIFLAMFVSLAAITILTKVRSSFVLSVEHKLVYAGLAALPFLLVRVLFTVLVSFNIDRTFFYAHVDVWAEAFMQFLMEAIVVMIFIVAGLLTPRVEKQKKASRHVVDYGDTPPPPMQQETKYPNAEDIETSSPPRAPSSQRRQRNLLDYRPSRLIRDYLSDRYSNRHST